MMLVGGFGFERWGIYARSFGGEVFEADVGYMGCWLMRFGFGHAALVITWMKTFGILHLPYSPHPSPLPYLNNIIPPTSRRSSIAIRSSDSPFLQQPHKLTHSIRDHNLCISFHQNIQLRVLAGLGLFARAVEAPFGGDGCSRCFEDFGDVRAVGDSPAGFF